MKCLICEFEISPSLKHSITKNECPACGGKIIDEELLKDIEDTIVNEIKIDNDQAKNLTKVLIAKYNFNVLKADREEIVEPIKVAPSSMFKQIEEKKDDIVEVSNIPDGISEIEREKIFEDAVRKKYNLMDGIYEKQIEEESDGEEYLIEQNKNIKKIPNSEAQVMADRLFGSGPGILEEERLMRLAKQQNALKSGPIRRR